MTGVQTCALPISSALSRLSSHPLENAFIDVAHIREILHEDQVEIAIAIRRLDEDESPT